MDPVLIRFTMPQVKTSRGMKDLVGHALKIFADRALAEYRYSTPAARQGLHCDPRKFIRARNFASSVRDLGGPEVISWTARDIEGLSLGEIKSKLELALVDAVKHLRSNYAIGKFYRVEECYIRRIKARGSKTRRKRDAA